VRQGASFRAIAFGSFPDSQQGVVNAVLGVVGADDVGGDGKERASVARVRSFERAALARGEVVGQRSVLPREGHAVAMPPGQVADDSSGGASGDIGRT
jgi:hypothetical protein